MQDPNNLKNRILDEESSLGWWGIFAYRIFYVIAFIIFFPYLIYMQYVGKKPLHLLERFWPKQLATREKCFLIHAVSVGETQAVFPLVKALMASFPTTKVVITNVTHTGHGLAKKLFPQADCLFLPFDFPWSVHRFFSSIHPSLVLVSEGDLWPEFLHKARSFAPHVIVVNGSVSDRTYRKLSKIPSIARWRARDVDFFCLQNEEAAHRLQSLGIEASRMSVTGSMKADCTFSPLSSQDRAALRASLGVGDHEKLITIASTHEPEEQLMCQLLFPLFKTHPDCKILVVPRHPERFSKVYTSLSSAFPAVANLQTAPSQSWNILVVNAMGMLSNLYQISHLAIVAGSFVEAVGGHNIIEPALAEIPVIVGPFMHSQKALIESARHHNAVIETDPSTVHSHVLQLLSEPSAYNTAVSNVRSWVESVQGASTKTLQCVLHVYASAF